MSRRRRHRPSASPVQQNGVSRQILKGTAVALGEFWLSQVFRPSIALFGCVLLFALAYRTEIVLAIKSSRYGKMLATAVLVFAVPVLSVGRWSDYQNRP